jgi:hypothetical protein
MRKKVLYFSIVIITISIGYLIHLNNTYFFNPVFFKKDRITHLPYDCYQKTMAYTYEKGGFSGKKNNLIRNDQHIRFLYEQFKQSKVIGNAVSKQRNLGRPFGCIAIYSDVDSPRQSSIVTEFYWYGKSVNEIAEVTGRINPKLVGYLYIKMTPELRRFLKENFK